MSANSPTKGQSITDINQNYKTADAALLQKATLSWLEEALQVVLSEKLLGDFKRIVKNGFILARLGKVVRFAKLQRQGEHPPQIAKLSQSDFREKVGETLRGYTAVANVDSFLQACREYGLKDHELCSPSDCVDSKNVTAVCNNVRCLAIALEQLSPPISLAPKFDSYLDETVISRRRTELMKNLFSKVDQVPVQPGPKKKAAELKDKTIEVSSGGQSSTEEGNDSGKSESGFPFKLVVVFIAGMLVLGQRRPKGFRRKGRDYSIRDGDTLSDLARKRYGDPDKWQRIVDRNPRLISRDPDLIFPKEKINL